MGLSVEIYSDATTITSSAEAWGTFGYAPPEFRSGGFKNPDAAGDIQTNMILGIAFAEAVAIYCLVVSLLIIFVA